MSENTPPSNPANKNLPFPLRIPPEVAGGRYANVFIINHTDNEFILDFGLQAPGLEEVTVFNRVIMTPALVERYLGVLTESYRKYQNNLAAAAAKKPTGPAN
ncbi:DUF3467 domain-containing protein [Myxococcota bacterium]|jgi:hypothetical protein|nr:DUF3467 domain-containing protein [Myxococcota bacterium]MBU1242643.1 DUF3467 domain-containing protein [Myxococcota bacterium]MBU1413751.1 DUF3467 domain-containing protein [Myxococcota bacterium]MBU1511985.1 DUF3467 domain-containing protein [Myxococcota bacterium]PKN23991.1 MAG: DUF3467 domain-containing protein [Deltaproteobacteria bacterium HGW-Deltaproteobacteria-22]